MTSERVYNISEASRLTGYTIPTIRARLPLLKKHGAIQTDKGWQIPESALHNAGLMAKVESSKITETAPASLQIPTRSEDASLLSDLRDQRDAALLRASVAEAVLEVERNSRERELAIKDEVISAQASHLRMLESGKSATPEPIAIATPAPIATVKRRWLSRS